ncbi:copper-transporting ATPase [Curtobacterium sp. 'Ferrero']|uniref:heavy-metal-associated domain-containing protein n=1 Tax=Curtobacterium sp. 'Ferrero' TaxID=2033654 RepID=UPI000BCBC6A7|nr:heavy-metal-associated domain-containing protein [Curtobacterium sp. 'Ferrero']PCN48187.1 copper-transporting ATPase [Curtobacterium sp. 'Ferrero']
MEQFEYHVDGMTCDHCERRVAAEVGTVHGVEHVTADASTGLVVVTADHRPDRDAIAEAVDEAGYELTRG